MSAKRIECVHAFLSRGCPVLWIKPDKVWAERARKVCGMDNDKGPYIDPEAAGISCSSQMVDIFFVLNYFL